MRYAGISPEIGLSETQQTLVLNGLRGQVRLQVDGQLKTGKDVIDMALLGADEFGFGTAALIVLGCVMMRKCHTNTCPVGVATQDENLRKHFRGHYKYVVNYFTFLAQEIREYLADMGFTSLNDIIGRTDLIEINKTPADKKYSLLDFAKMLYKYPGARIHHCQHRPVGGRHALGCSGKEIRQPGPTRLYHQREVQRLGRPKFRSVPAAWHQLQA